MSEIILPEVWKPIEGTDGKYEASTEGNIRSWVLPLGRGRRDEPLILKPSDNGEGYPCVNFAVNGKRVCRIVSNFVLETHVGSRPTPAHEAAHLDNNPWNNRLTNIIWATPKENQSHRRTHGTMLFRERRIEGGQHVYRCTKCGVWKPAAGFYSNKHTEYGIASECRKCGNAERSRRRREKNAAHAVAAAGEAATQ
jgi:hypothetical protein